jgi:hypothetical protein
VDSAFRSSEGGATLPWKGTLRTYQSPQYKTQTFWIRPGILLLVRFTHWIPTLSFLALIVSSIAIMLVLIVHPLQDLHRALSRPTLVREPAFNLRSGQTGSENRRRWDRAASLPESSIRRVASEKNKLPTTNILKEYCMHVWHILEKFRKPILCKSG